MNQNFDWMMREAIYEPGKTVEPAHRAPLSLRWKLALVCFALFLVGCGLAGLSAWQPQL